MRMLSPKSREPRNTPNTRKHDITVEVFISVCSVCSVVKKNGISSSLKDGTGNADVPRAALRFALGYLILPLWGGDIITLSCGNCPHAMWLLSRCGYLVSIPQERNHLEGIDDLEFPVALVKRLFQLSRISKPQDVIVAGH